MQRNRIHEIHHDPSRGRATAPGRLLLIGSEHAFTSEATRRFFGEDRFQITTSTKSLLDGLAQLESGPVDLVLLSDEFREEEMSLFTFDAYRRGFTGLILRVASLPKVVAEIRQFSRERLKSEPAEERLATRADWDRARAKESDRSLHGPRNPPFLTMKQQVVVTRISEGWSNQKIAGELRCSEGSVKAILQQLFRKYGVRKRTQIVRLAIEGLPAVPRRLQPREVTAGSAIESTDPADAGPIEVGDFVIDVAGHRAWVRGREAQFTPLELRLLTFLSRHPQELLSHLDLMEALWGRQPATRESLRVLVRAVRKKIETSERPRYIVTQPYYGYRFIPL